MAKRTAVIDIGSNSLRMVIFERTSRFAFHLVHETKSRVRISEHAYENNNFLQEEALERAYSALSEFMLTIKQYKVRKTLCVATSALRDAPNRQTFVSRIKKELGLHIKVIEGEEEAYLGGIAAANLLHLGTALSIDIGGGSTELAFYENKKVLHTHSLNLGTVRLKELYFDNGNIEGAKKHILHELEKLPLALRHENIIGIGGTLRALSKIIIDKEEVGFKKLHGFSFDVSKQQAFFSDILQADTQTLKKAGVKEERLDVIQPGVLIFDLLIKHVEAKQVIISGVGVREGVFLRDLLRTQQDKFPSNYNPSVNSLLDRFGEKKKSELFGSAGKLFDLSAERLKIKPKYRPLFLTAVKLSQIGKALDFYEAHRHAYYILLSGLNYGFSHKETLLIATLVRYQRNKSPSSSHLSEYKSYLPSKETIHALSYLMSLSLALFGEFDHGNDLHMHLDAKGLHISAKQRYLIQEKLKDLCSNDSLDISLSDL